MRTKPKNKEHLVYGLTDPEGSVRYIGKSSSGLERPRKHGCPSAVRAGTHKANWIASLRRKGLDYGIVVLRKCESETEALAAEVEEIAKYRSLGADLTNMTDGGDGVNGFSPSLEARSLMSKAKVGRKLTLEHRVKISMANKGQVPAMKGKSHTDESRKALSRKRGGKPFCDSFGNRYDTLGEASRALNIRKSSIHQVLRGRARVAGGVSFAYVKERNTLNGQEFGDYRP